MPPMRRRLALIALASLAGCGFELKRPPQLQARRIQLRGFGDLSTMADELKRQLRASPGVQLVEAATDADLVLDAVLDRREQVLASATATGLVSEMTLRVRLRFAVRNPSGTALIPETELLMSRDMGYSEANAMAKESESELLYRALESDIATQVLRRLAALD